MDNKLTQWMIPNRETVPGVILFRNVFKTSAPAVLEFDYSTDEYGAIFLDGEFLEYGSERACSSHWYFNHFRHALSAGNHELVFRVLFLGQKYRPYAWMSVAHGLWLNESSRVLNGGQWQWRQFECQLDLPQFDWGQAPRVHIGSAETGNVGHEWFPVAWRSDDRKLFPATLPAMRREAISDFRREECDGVTVITLPVYSCMYADYVFSGTGSVKMHYLESPELLGKKIELTEPGVIEDHFELCGNSYHWVDLWFRAGKVVEFRFTGSAKLEKFCIWRTGYPWNFDLMGNFPEDVRLKRLFEKAIRTVECCTENTYMDCPYYERLQYVSDSRVEMLSCYCLSSDRRLQRKALFVMGQAMREDGALECRYPAKDWEKFHIFEPTAKCNPMLPGFCFYYIQMLHDYAQLREDDELVGLLLPTARRIVSWAEGFSQNGILTELPGWNFIDWRPNWKNGTPPGCVRGTGCTLNWIFVRSLKDLADLEQKFGTPGRAQAFREMADEHIAAIERTYFVPERGLFAENAERDYFSEHAQVWALLAADRREVLPGLFAGNLDECGIYFSFYYMAVCRLYNREDAFRRRLEQYLTLADDPRIDTLPEEFADWRSWCHAWSSHILYFYYAPRVGLLDPIGEKPDYVHSQQPFSHF